LRLRRFVNARSVLVAPTVYNRDCTATWNPHGMSNNPRIEALRRRLERDPASIAFAQLAEEYRRGGDYQQAITICREGLTRHPGYLSAQVTLGRALIELKQFDDARHELEAVLSVAPDNLAAIRALAEIHQHVGETDIGALGEPEIAMPVPVAVEARVDTPPLPEALPPPIEEPDPALPALEQWLAAIVADRAHSR
jgi:tetratricopeptide (TPR) repeat protein